MTAKLYGHESEIPLQARYLSGLLSQAFRQGIQFLSRDF